MPPAITPRPRIKQADRTLAAFIAPGPEADLIRVDGKPWLVVAKVALEVISDPRSRPEAVVGAVHELLRLATVADAIVKELFAD